jgi:hypothetical protein
MEEVQDHPLRACFIGMTIVYDVFYEIFFFIPLTERVILKFALSYARCLLAGRRLRNFEEKNMKKFGD